MTQVWIESHFGAKLRRRTLRILCKCLYVTSLVWIGVSPYEGNRAVAQITNGQKPRDQDKVLSEFMTGDMFPAEIREMIKNADKAEQESRWSDAAELRRQVKAQCERKFGRDDWRVVESGWRLSLVEWILEAPNKHGELLSEFRETIGRRDALLAVGDVRGAFGPIKELDSHKFAADALRPWRVFNALVFGEALSAVHQYREAMRAQIIAIKTFDECSSSPHPLSYRIDLQFGLCLAYNFARTPDRIEASTKHGRDVYANLAEACGDDYAIRNGALLLAQTLDLNGEWKDANELYTKVLAQWDGRTTLDKIERGTVLTTRAECCLAKGDLENAQQYAIDAQSELIGDEMVFRYPKSARTFIILFRVLRVLADKAGQEEAIAAHKAYRELAFEKIAAHLAYNVKSCRGAGELDKAYELQWALVDITKERWGAESSEHTKALQTASELAESLKDTATVAVLKERLRK